MIDGIVIELTTEELRGFLKRRVDFHREGHREYTAKAAAYSGDTVDDRIGAREYGDKASREAANAAFYEIAVTHLIENETFRLTIEQFGKIFVIKTE